MPFGRGTDLSKSHRRPSKPPSCNDESASVSFF